VTWAVKPSGDPVEVLDAWEVAQQAAGLSVNTIRARYELLLRFATWLGSDPRTAQLTDVQRYLAQPMAAASRAIYWRHLRSFLDFRVSTDRLTRSPLLLVKRPRQPKGYHDRWRHPC
jgi:site-specific recombinase XerD